MGRDDIRASIDNAIGYLSNQPDEARYTDSEARAILEDGLRLRVEGPADAHVVTDMPESVGGGASAPSPGWMLRAALASCDATLIAMRAAHQGIDLTRLDVTVDSESDDRGILGMDDAIPAGPLSVRVRVRIAADGVGDEQLREIVAWATQHCPVDDAVRRAVPVSVEVVPE